MENVLHFSKEYAVAAKTVGKIEDSGNGFYSYCYYLLPYTGTIVDAYELSKVALIIHKKIYRPPFCSLGVVEHFATSETGGLILYSVTYHHGD